MKWWHFFYPLCLGGIRRYQALETVGTVGLPLSPHSTFVTNFFLPILLLCWNNSLLSVQLAHPHSSKLLRQSHILPSVPPCTDVFLLSRTKRCCPKRRRCLFHDAGIWLSLFAYSSLASPHCWTFPQWWSRIHNIFWFCFSFLSLVSFPKV